MAVERAPGGSSLIDVLDRILDKGIVVDAWVRISLVGIDLITVEARVVIASIDTYLKYAEAVGITPTVSRPALGPGESGRSESSPFGESGFKTGTGNSVVLPVFGSSFPIICSPKLMYQAIPSESTMTSCGCLVGFGKSYSVMMT